MVDQNMNKKQTVHSILTDLRSQNLISQEEWNKVLAAWVGDEAMGVELGSVRELGAAIWKAFQQAQGYWQIRKHFPAWAEEVRAIFCTSAEREWAATARKLGFPNDPQGLGGCGR